MPVVGRVRRHRGDVRADPGRRRHAPAGRPRRVARAGTTRTRQLRRRLEAEARAGPAPGPRICQLKGTTMTMQTPPIVSREVWDAALAEMLVKEKELTRARDALAAQRRRMPWLEVRNDYRFDGPDGE